MSSLSSDLRSNRTDRTSIFLVGNVNHQITGFKLPSNRQVLAVLFFNLREVNLTVKESATLTIRECLIFWEKARIPTKHPQNCIKKLEDLYESWRRLQKNASKSQNVYRERENEFQNILDNLFDVAHADALKNIEKEEDRIFLQRQREPGRVGYLAGVDKNLAKKEERIRQRIEAEERRRQMYLEKSAASTSSDGCNSENLDKEDVSSLSSDEDDKVKNGNKRGTKDLLSPKVVAVLDRCQLSTRDTVFLLQAVLEELGFDTDEFSISQSSIQRKRVERREERAKFIKETFQNEVPEVVTVHWDGKLMPAPNPRESKEERLPIIITHQNGEQLIDVPNLENSTGKAQAKAVFDALSDWNLVDKVQIMCCDTTASNTGCYNGACVLLEQYLDRDLLLFACRHHVYELVLKGVFESKLPQVTSSPDTPLFKNFRDGWKNIDSTNFESGIECISHLSISEINDLSTFYHDELQKPAIRDDYQELIQLCILFLDRDVNQNLKIHPPGAINQARWMARAIYSLKIFLLKSQCDLTEEEEEGLKAVCCFIVSTYVKPWLECILAVKAPYQDLCFLKSLKAYENVDKTISDAALKKFCSHLWYLNEEISILSLFDNDVTDDQKTKIVQNLSNEPIPNSGKRYIPSKKEIQKLLYAKNLEDFVSKTSLNFLTRMKISNTSFLDAPCATWKSDESFLSAQGFLYSLKAVNDTAERGVRLLEEYNGKITRSREQQKYLLRTVKEHREVFPIALKKNLKRKL